MERTQYLEIGIKVDLYKLISTRLLLQASSGGGKSYAIRKLAEQAIGKVQVLIIDIEGEFVTLREKYPFALIGKDGDIPLSTRHAEVLAHKLLETNLSAIIDLSEMEIDQRKLFAKRFLNALVESPKDLWHEVIVIIDEADFFAPEGKESESTRSVINLTSRGRKRGICAVLATQRIAKLHKDATADILNKIIGLTGQDIDQARAGKELGFVGQDKISSLRKLKPGEFYGFGPAISYEVQKFKVSKVTTTHMQSGQFAAKPPVTPLAIKKILSKLQSIPEEAERELTTRQDLESEVRRLKAELKKKNGAHADKPFDDTQLSALKQKVNEMAVAYSAEKKYSSLLYKHLQKIQTGLKGISGLITDIPQKEQDIPVINLNANYTKKEPVYSKNPVEKVNQNVTKSMSVAISGSGDYRMLQAAAMYFPEPISKKRMAAIAGLKHSSGTFGTYLAKLSSSGFLSGSRNEYQCTKHGYEYVKAKTGVPELPDNLVGFWINILGSGSGCARMLQALADAYPNSLTKENIGLATGLSSSSGTFGTYLSKLTSNALVEKRGSAYCLAPELINN